MQRLGECQLQGWSFTYYSDVQCHIKPFGQDKVVGLLQVLHKYYPQLIAKQIVTVGDCLNDDSLFDPSKFTFSVGVANVLHYAKKLTYQPLYITNSSEGQGFCELAQALIPAARQLSHS